MPEQIAPEPSMDEILASIRRIVSEDDEALGEAPARPAKQNETTAGSGGADPDADVLELTERAPLEPAIPSGPAPADEPLVGEPASVTTASSFERLSAAVDTSAKDRRSLAMPAPGRSLEDVTRDLLRPLLKAWLDEHLPAIVRDRVDEEVSRIARGRVR